MSDTLPERENDYDMDRERIKFQEELTRAMVQAGAREVALPVKEDQKAWLECCQGYSHAPWCSEYKEPVKEAAWCPTCGTLNCANPANHQTATTEHQPAARGGGEGCLHSDKTWHVHQNGTDVACDHDYIAIATTRKHAAQIVREHNQYQSLVAERERLRAFVQEFSSKGCVLRGETCLERNVVSPCIRCRATALLGKEV